MNPAAGRRRGRGGLGGRGLAAAGSAPAAPQRLGVRCAHRRGADTPCSEAAWRGGVHLPRRPSQSARGRDASSRCSGERNGGRAGRERRSRLRHSVLGTRSQQEMSLAAPPSAEGSPKRGPCRARSVCSGEAQCATCHPAPPGHCAVRAHVRVSTRSARTRRHVRTLHARTHGSTDPVRGSCARTRVPPFPCSQTRLDL